MRLLPCLILLLLLPTAAIADNGDKYYGDKPPRQAMVLPGYSPEEAKARLDASPLQPIEGIWEYPDEMVTVVVERFSSPQFSGKLKYRIVLIDSEDLSLLPGTVIGYIAESADDRKFELWLYSGHIVNIQTQQPEDPHSLQPLTFLAEIVPLYLNFSLHRQRRTSDRFQQNISGT